MPTAASSTAKRSWIWRTQRRDQDARPADEEERRPGERDERGRRDLGARRRVTPSSSQSQLTSRTAAGLAGAGEEQLELDACRVLDDTTIGAVGIVTPNSVKVSGAEPTTTIVPFTSCAWSGIVTSWRSRGSSACRSRPR